MKQYLLILSLLVAHNLIAQDSVTVGSHGGMAVSTSLTNSFGPMFTNTVGSDWNRHAYIYPASLLTSLKSGTAVNEISFFRFTSTNTYGQLAGTVTFKIYLKNTTAADFGSGNADWGTETTNATLVYNGTSTDITNIVGNSVGLKHFPFSSNFTYTGGGIELLVEYTQSAAATGEVVWGYDNSSTVSAYTTNQTKYTSGTGNIPGSTVLNNSNARHPSMILYFNGTNCKGPLLGGTIPNSVNVCQGNYTVLNAAGYSPDNGISIRWQQSYSATGPWIASTSSHPDSMSVYLTDTLTSTRYYRLKVGCSFTGDSAFSNVDTVNVISQPTLLPLTMGFNTTTSEVVCLSQDQVTDNSTLPVPVSPSVIIVSNSPNPTGKPISSITPHEGDRLVNFNSHDCDPGDAIRFKMPELTTKGLAGVDMYYWYYQINGQKASTDNITVQYSFDNKNWVSVPASTTYITNTSLDSTHNGWQKVFLSLPAAVANQDSLWIGLLFTSGYGYNIDIDDIKIGATGTLPVKYLDIAATKSGVFNKISWTTYDELENNYFEVEQSSNGKDFSAIAKVNTKAVSGDSQTELQYSFTDANPGKGNNYYRIKQVDKNGNSTYSSIVLVKSDISNGLFLNGFYPNPVLNNKGKLNISSNDATNITISILDIAGKIVKQYSNVIQSGNNELELNLSGIQKGTYFVRINNYQYTTNSLLFRKD